ncbi:unnamed protein product [Adineta steineri]|uniref:inositol-polyphosphate 5-phosphatase n=1 Tax=Adineta steineri TaxID=433720 RepID=A0A814DF83_9BILA|nr:unnamed protein product [Adineta steineri]
MNNDEVFITNRSNIRFLLITANTGTIFEKPELLTAWVIEFANLLRSHPSDFIALHFQEVGGKDYETYMYILDTFIKNILQVPEISTDYTRYRLYFDSDYTSQDTFTALGSAYFIRQNIPIEQWNFPTSSFQNVVNRQIYTGNLINVETLRKEKFPREFFPEAKWSRKGFTQARWSINGFIFDMINVHLFHDASNILAVEQSPSVYSTFRKNALGYTLRHLSLNPSDPPVPYIIFGDFNFRLDAHRFIQNIVEKRNGLIIDKIKQANNNEISKILIQNAQNKIELTIEKKEFNLHNDHDSFFSNDIHQFQMYDFEPLSFTDDLYEFPKTFPPSYPYSEEFNEPRAYLRARCPAWCDRVLLSHSFKDFINTEITPPTYDVIGKDVCMGDHKPVYLALTIYPVQGWSTSPLPLSNSVSPSLPFSSNSEDSNATTKNNNIDQTKSLVTVMRELDMNLRSCIILNETPLSSDDINLFNVHDYAIFTQPTVLPECWFAKLQQRPIKSVHVTNNSSSALWTKVRAITYMTTLAHRTGSWYSDDRTEHSPVDDEASLSDNDETFNRPNLEFNDVESCRKPDLAIPLRRSFSSIDYVKHIETYTPGMCRSRSTTLISSSDQPSDSSPIELSPPTTPSSITILSSSSPPPSIPIPSSSPSLPPSLPPSSRSLPQSPSRVYRFLHCTNDNVVSLKKLLFTNCTDGLISSNRMNNNKSQEINSSLAPTKHSTFEFKNLNKKKLTSISMPTTINNNNDHRIILTRHRLHADIKQTYTRWIRETPV